MLTNEITIGGNLTADPVLHDGGKVPFTTFGVACSKRVRVPGTDNDWTDEFLGYYNIKTFRGLATHCAETLRKGQRVVVSGTLSVTEWSKNGKSGMNIDIAADDVAVSLFYGPVILPVKEEAPKPEVAQAPAPVQDTTDVAARMDRLESLIAQALGVNS